MLYIYIYWSVKYYVYFTCFNTWSLHLPFLYIWGFVLASSAVSFVFKTPYLKKCFRTLSLFCQTELPTDAILFYCTFCITDFSGIRCPPQKMEASVLFSDFLLKQGNLVAPLLPWLNPTSIHHCSRPLRPWQASRVSISSFQSSSGRSARAGTSCCAPTLRREWPNLAVCPQCSGSSWNESIVVSCVEIKSGGSIQV